MQIDSRMFVPFIGFMVKNGHKRKPKRDELLLRKGDKVAVMDISKMQRDIDTMIDCNEYCYQRYKAFLHGWLGGGKQFIERYYVVGSLEARRTGNSIAMEFVR